MCLRSAGLVVFQVAECHRIFMPNYYYCLVSQPHVRT